MIELKGIFAASLSILKNDLSLDIDSTIKHAENVIDMGCHGAVFFGSTGQSQLISLSEKIQLINQLPNSKYRDKNKDVKNEKIMKSLTELTKVFKRK